ncbi:MAG: right-handed parallel beta-helix repeat-containing protein [Gemmatimonadaceae bacterium]
MRLQSLVSTTFAVAALVGVLACSPDSVSSPDWRTAPSANHASGGGRTLVVDNDLADCPNADFTTIQGAVTAAEPGATILVCAGTYLEQVVIAKNDLRILAKGKPGDVVLDGLDLPAMRAGFRLENAHRNLIQGFLVQNYHEAGIWLRTGSSGNTIRMNVTTGSPFHDGIQLQNAPRNLVEHNTAFANVSPMFVACGINVIGGGSDGNVVRHNEAYDNDFGIQVAAGADNNVIFGNESHDNRRFGIRNLAGSNGTALENNRSLNNAGPGIAVLSSTGVTVARNKAFDNAPDILWDLFGANDFENNHCRTSVPPGLCEHTEGASKK